MGLAVLKPFNSNHSIKENLSPSSAATVSAQLSSCFWVVILFQSKVPIDPRWAIRASQFSADATFVPKRGVGGFAAASSARDDEREAKIKIVAIKAGNKKPKNRLKGLVIIEILVTQSRLTVNMSVVRDFGTDGCLN